MPMHSTAAVVSIVLVCALASCSAEQALEGDGLALMESLGLRAEQEDVDKSVWEARQAKEAEEAEDEEIARLMAKLEGLDQEKAAAEAEATQKDIEAKQATASKLKEVANQKLEAARAAIDAKAKKVEEAALSAQKDAEDMITSTKDMRAKAAAAMERGRAASAEYQAALASGQTDGLEELAATAQKAMAEAKALAEEAGGASDKAKVALKNAAEIKSKADRAISMEKESRKQLADEGIEWAAGPIFGKMKRLCEQDYPTFRTEYQKIRESPSYKQYRWDIKKACKKAHNDDLESDDLAALKAAQDAAAADAEVEAPQIDPSKPYPDNHGHFSLPADKKVKKWCTTKFGAVPCSMLKKAQEAGLLGDAVDTNSKEASHVTQLDEYE
jgi:chromosome segregation ATPase